MSNLIMVDVAGKDRRSVKAMLNGNGDGREQRWEKFERLHGAQMSTEELEVAFKKASRKDAGKQRSALQLVKRALLLTLVAAVVAT